MMTTRLATVILCASIWATPYCQLYTHERVASMPFIGWLVALSQSGDYAYSAGYGTVRDPYELYVNGVNYLEHMFPESMRYAGPPFFRSDGALLWTAVWLDGDHRYSHLVANRAGQYALSGKGDLMGRRTKVFQGQWYHSASVVGAAHEIMVSLSAATT